ncbi:MAG: hypothetical protein GSR86_04195 [Desulfurococcales archaeon]|nr:hypothetical protein [Desulfurococcales archaeon]
MGRVRVKLLASLKELAGGRSTVEVEASGWRDALARLASEYPGLRSAINDDGTPRPGILVFVDGVDYRLSPEGGREVVVLPVNHGGVEVEIIDWDDVEDTVEDVVSKMMGDGLRPDVIIGIMRGGIVPARLIADALGVDDITVMEIKLYKSMGVKTAQPYIRQPLVRELKDKEVLVVDDISDSGLSLQLALQAISLYSPSSIVTATLYVKPWTRLYPDYYSRVTDKWVIFPWEKHEYRREVQVAEG